MHRRELLKAIGVLPLAAAGSCAFTAEHYGRIGVEAWQRHAARGEYLDVFLDGEDVTLQCIEADDEDGHVILLCHDRAHHHAPGGSDPPHLRHHDEVCTHRLRGHVTIRPRRHRHGHHHERI